jgi:hypothetical protein
VAASLDRRMHERQVMSMIKTVLLQGHSLARSPGSSTSVLIITRATPASGLDSRSLSSQRGPGVGMGRGVGELLHGQRAFSYRWLGGR